MIVEDGVGDFEKAAALDGDERRIARPGADEVNLAGHLRPSAGLAGESACPTKISRAPDAMSCSPSLRPSDSASSTGPSAFAWTSSDPSGETTTPKRWRRPDSMVAWAPMGT